MSNEGDYAREDHEIAHMDDAPSVRDSIRDKRDAEAYRAMFDSVDVSMHERHAETRATMSNAVSGRLTEAVKGIAVNDMPSGAWKTMTDLRQVVIARENLIADTATKVLHSLTDDRYFPPSRVRDADEKLSTAKADLDAHRIVFDAAMDGARTELLDVARPAVRQGDEVTARSDARMLLDGASTPQEASRRMREYVSAADDSVSGMLSDPRWIQTYFTSRGWAGDLYAVIPTINATIAESARQSTDKGRKAAGQALANLHHYQAAFDGTTAMTRTMDPRRKVS